MPNEDYTQKIKEARSLYRDSFIDMLKNLDVKYFVDKTMEVAKKIEAVTDATAEAFRGYILNWKNIAERGINQMKVGDVSGAFETWGTLAGYTLEPIILRAGQKVKQLPGVKIDEDRLTLNRGTQALGQLEQIAATA